MRNNEHIEYRELMRKSAIAMILLAFLVSPAGAQQRFYSDDPISREPAKSDASKAQMRDIDLMYDLAKNLFAVPRDPKLIRAKNINSIDEVPDSDWFTNRILAKPLSIEDVIKGPDTGKGPAPGNLTITHAKQSGVTPGFTMKDSAGQTWFVQFDAPGQSEAASGATVVATKLFYALGYFQTENHISVLDPKLLVIGDSAKVDTPSGHVRAMTMGDIKKVLARADKRPDGTYRILASRGIPGRIIGGFKYAGMRKDDPNDIVPHEHRRELRALKVFGAWTNLVDMKAGNTLDTVITENGRTFIRHYLQDVGSTFGTGALAPREWDEGYEYIIEKDKTLSRLVTLGFDLEPWQTIPYTEYKSIGRFEGDYFKPENWKPRIPTAAMVNARADDNFWAALRVMAFTDEMIRAVVKAGQYSDPAAEKHLANVLIKRRDKIGQAYLPAVNPLVDFRLDAPGVLTFDNAAVRAGFAKAPQGGYEGRWYRFDNSSGASTPIGTATVSTDLKMQAPAGLPIDNGEFIKIEVVAVNPPTSTWKIPIQVYFRKVAEGWKLVGLQRMPD
ncbi:MAG TPA: hypothetical protein VMG30_16085 [Acidobacteriota bacterium]|nr:hypothetical protein [Acidobacteriota bacterium]